MSHHRFFRQFMLRQCLNVEERVKFHASSIDQPIVAGVYRQVLNLIHTPLAVVTKAAVVVSDEVFIDMMPVAWELLIETDQELAAAAGN